MIVLRVKNATDIDSVIIFNYYLFISLHGFAFHFDTMLHGYDWAATHLLVTNEWKIFYVIFFHLWCRENETEPGKEIQKEGLCIDWILRSESERQ